MRIAIIDYKSVVTDIVEKMDVVMSVLYHPSDSSDHVLLVDVDNRIGNSDFKDIVNKALRKQKYDLRISWMNEIDFYNIVHMFNSEGEWNKIGYYMEVKPIKHKQK